MRAQFNAQIYEEACEWFIECRAGDLSDIARAEFDRWLRKSPEHQSAYLEIAAIWNEGPTLDPANRWDVGTLIAQAAEDSGKVVALERTPRPTQTLPAPHEAPRAATHTRRRTLAIAACILLAAIALGTYVLAPRGAYTTALGEQRSLALSDGSTVQLNSLSKIRIRYTEHERTVDLIEGQALFHVAKEATRPFIVYSGQTRVRAVGTQFDVYRKSDGTVVTVVEGRVAILGTPAPADSSARSPRGEPERAAQRPPEDDNASASAEEGHPSVLKHQGKQSRPKPAPALDATQTNPGPEGAIFLAAGEQLTVTAQAAQKSAHPNVASATAWTQRELVFDAAPLSEVADEFNRYNERKLVIDPSALGDFHISGVFSSTDPASLIRFLRDRPGLRVTETPTTIRVEKDL